MKVMGKKRRKQKQGGKRRGKPEKWREHRMMIKKANGGRKDCERLERKG